jgi:hypothetical protein
MKEMRVMAGYIQEREQRVWLFKNCRAEQSA